MAARIPTFYRLVFTYFDVLNCILAAYFYFFQRDFSQRYIHPTSPRNRDHDLVYFNMGGTMLLIGVLHGGLLRYTSDVNVWKIVNFAVLLLDLSLLVGVGDGLAKRGVTSLEGVTSEDWANITVTSCVTVVRMAFIAGLGMRREKHD
jgi:DMSO reductase anchor subunit